MRIVPVIDLKGGVVVRGVGGRRDEYRPIVSRLAATSDPAAIASAFVQRCAASTVYVADLDAIERDSPDVSAWRAIAGAGLRLWVDAGVGTAERAAAVSRLLAESGVRGELVIGLESVPTVQKLAEVRSAAGDGAIFSLDLRSGQPIARCDQDRSLTPSDWARHAVRAGFRRLIVLDLADVGVGKGTGTLELCRQIHVAWPQVELIAGGGVRNRDDLQRIAAAGCSAALVASALHDGSLECGEFSPL